MKKKATKISHGIKLGDIFTPILKRTIRSKDLMGNECAGRYSAFSPEVATKIGPYMVGTAHARYSTRHWYFRKENKHGSVDMLNG